MVTRRVFFSFHYKPDNSRAAQVRNMGLVDGNAPVSDNDWETVTKGGDAAIQKWIDGQIYGKSCAVVLIGQPDGRVASGSSMKSRNPGMMARGCLASAFTI